MKSIYISLLLIFLTFSVYAGRTIVSTALEISNTFWFAGDTIVMKNGTWTDQSISLRADGTAEQAIVLMAETPGEVILTGSSTGEEANVHEAELIKSKIAIPVLIGSGIDVNNIQKFYNYADAFIIGSYFKEKGYWANKLDIKRIADFMKVFNSL